MHPTDTIVSAITVLYDLKCWFSHKYPCTYIHIMHKSIRCFLKKYRFLRHCVLFQWLKTHNNIFWQRLSPYSKMSDFCFRHFPIFFFKLSARCGWAVSVDWPLSSMPLVPRLNDCESATAAALVTFRLFYHYELFTKQILRVQCWAPTQLFFLFCKVHSDSYKVDISFKVGRCTP